MPHLTPSPHILLLDADPATADQVQQLLEAGGVAGSLTLVQQAADALTALRVRGYDLIIVAALAPDMDALTLWRQAREICPGVPVLVFSDALGEDAIIRVLSEDGSEYVAKSHPGRLAPIVRKLFAECDGCHKQQVTQAALDAAGIRLQDIAESLPGGIYQLVRRPDGRFHFAYLSERCMEITGVTEWGEHTRAEHELARIAQADLPGVLESTAVSATGMQLWDQEFRITMTDGSIRWVHAISMPRSQEDGGIMWTGIFFDITAEKARDQALLEARSFSAAVLDIVGALVVVIDRQGNVVEFNRACEALTGYRAKEILGGPVWKLWPQAQRTQVQDVFATLTAGQFPHAHENCWLTQAGGERLIAWNNTCLTDAQGRVNYVIASGIDVTEERADRGSQHRQRQELERLVAERTARLETQARIIEQIHDAVVSTDMEGQITSWNQGAERLFGYCVEEVIGRPIAFVFPEEPLDFLAEQVIAPLKARGEHAVEVRMRHKSGQNFHAHLSLSLLRDLEAGMSGMIGYITDITERKRSEEALALYARVMAASSVSMVIADATAPDLPLIYVNPAFEAITGYASAEVLGRNCRFLQGPERDQPGLMEIRAAQAEGRDGRALLHNFRKDGSPFWNELVITPVHDQTGKLTHFIGIGRDISQRLEMEEALRASEQALQTSEARLRSVLDSVVDGIVVIDEWGGIESFNPAAERIFGYASEEVHGRNVSLLMPEPDRSAHDGYLKNHLDTGRKKIIGLGREVIGRRKEGGTFPMDLAVSAIRIGEKRCFTGIVRDISERKRIEWEMLQALEAAISASRAKSEFLSSMSHELRTPMNAILGFGQLLQMDSSLAPEQADSAREIVNAGRHLLALINEVLDLARIESGKLTLSMEPVELLELIEECAVLVKSGALRQGLAVHLNAANCQGRWARADRLRLKQVLINLLSNAVKYNRAGGSVHIVCEFKTTGRVRLAVSDTGPGIPEDKLAELFTPFNRLGLEAGSIEGSGIGLVISKRLVEMMGGEIGVDSRLGQGCTFWVELAETEPLAAPPMAPDAAPAKAAGRPRRHTLLYVEDNPANLRLMQLALALRQDIRLLSCGDPLIGLELARSEHPDLIMLDINLPGMSGYEMLMELQTDADTRTIPVLAITANAMPEDVERGLAAGFLAYLTKPLDLARLQTEIDRILEITAQGASGN